MKFRIAFSLLFLSVGAVALAAPSAPDPVGTLGDPIDVPAAPAPGYAPPPPGYAYANPGQQAAAPAGQPDFEALLAQLNREEKATEKALNDLGAEAENARRRTIARGRAYVRKSRAGLLPVGGGFDELVNHASRLERLRRALERDLSAEKALIKKRSKLSKRLADLRARKGPLEAQARITSQQRAALLAQQDRASAFERAFSNSVGSWDNTAIYGADPGSPGAGPSQEASAFGALKGRLPFPLPGRANVRKASRGGGGPGLEMTAPKGAPVRAVYKGRVAFADEYPDYGRTVILEHGGGYYTVSAGLDSFAVKVGDDVSSGDRLGTVGDDGRGAMLYFEVRDGADPLQPSEWFGLE
ncbi:MAG: peptidoglycan DD-metalloendopeptidase family protein [Polyangiaceae bacterium]